MTINDRFNAIIQFLFKGNKRAFALHVGVSPSVVENVVGTRQGKPSFDFLEKVCANANISAEWLLMGKGEMVSDMFEFRKKTMVFHTNPKCYENNMEENSVDENKPTLSPDAAPTINQDYQGAPYYNVDFIGGFDIISPDQTTNPDYYINYPPYNKEGILWCNLTGHSMEPELSNGDVIAIKEINGPIQYLPSGEIYGIVTDEYRTVKRIRLSKREGYVWLIPSNKSEEYCEQEIPISMIIKIYAVLGSIRKFF